MKIDIEFGGGLGDIINQAYRYGGYIHLNKLSKDYTAEIYLITHNPYATELFQWHPKREFFNLHDCGYWSVLDNDANKEKNNIPKNIPWIAKQPGDIIFYEPEDDKKVLSSFLNKKFIVMAASAGDLHRNIPMRILDNMVLKFNELNIELVTVGRDYSRNNREELRIPGTTDLINKLSVPGTLKLIELSSGLITCHSALNIYAWHINKPQLLLYPKEVQNRHFLATDQWSFGKDFDNTVHCTFDDYNMADHLFKFTKIIGEI